MTLNAKSGVFERQYYGLIMNCSQILQKICEIAVYTLIALFVAIILIASYCIMNLMGAANKIDSYSDFATAFVALFALVVTYYEYLNHKDINQAQVLSEYNQRYSNDPNIVKVVKYLNYNDEGGYINNLHPDQPSNYEVEMFMRFFEELELQIEKGRLSEKDVCNLFTYYAHFLSLHDQEELRHNLGITDNDYDKHWSGFKRITERHNKNQQL